jgi:hypothetical protein
MFLPSLPPCAIDQNAPHRLGGGEEVPSALPALRLPGIHQAYVGLMDQGSWLQGLPRKLVGQASSREFLQFVVHERQQSLRREQFALLHLSKNLSDVVHFKKCKPLSEGNQLGAPGRRCRILRASQPDPGNRRRR